jgi:hypothetical protein
MGELVDTDFPQPETHVYRINGADYGVACEGLALYSIFLGHRNM